MATDLLNDKQVKNMKATEKTATYSDGNGMHLEVTASCSKRWRFRYRFNGKAKLVSLGVYPEITLKDARTRRDEARIKVAKDIDPFPKKTKRADTKAMEESKEKTFKEWSEYYMVKVADDVSETHLARSLKGFKADVYPYIGAMMMNDIKPKHIIQILNVMAARDAKESAKKVFSSISRVFQVCMANFPDDIERNPTKDIAMKDILGKRKEVHYPIITEQKELGALLTSIDGYTGHTSTKIALKMIANVFVRPHNIRHAEWSEFNLKTKQWVIPANKMKTRNELIVPLSKQVMQIVSEAKKYSGESKYLFPSPKSINTPLSDGALVGALRRLGYTKDEIVAHSFRGIFSTIAHEQAKFSHDVIETQLAHSVGSAVSKAYNRAEHLPQRVEMMQWYSDLLGSYTKK